MQVFVVNAFAEKLFSGNPAAVCPLDQWPADKLMQQIAAENNLAETAFVVNEQDGYRIRWFTPATEVDLCGHATLASAHVLFNHLNFEGDELSFNSRSGKLTVTRDGEKLVLNFPVDQLTEVEETEDMRNCFAFAPVSTFKGKTDYMFIFDTQQQIEQIGPDFNAINKLDGRGIIVTAPGDEVDFVSRFFAPQSGIDEDPVTGSAHTSLTPYWAGKIGKTEFSAVQLSSRGGKLQCKLQGERVLISGKAITYLIGNIQSDNF